MSENSSLFFEGKFITRFNVLQQKMQHIKAFVFDWDGVFNNGHKNYEGSNSFSEVDSFGITMMRFSYYLQHGKHAPVAVITGEQNKASFYFAQREHYNHIFYRVGHKEAALRFFCEQHQLQPSEVLFVFDDVLDLSAAAIAGVRILVQHACNSLFADYAVRKNLVDYITSNDGNNGALREATELYMFANNNFEETIDQRVAFSKQFQTFISQRNELVTNFHTMQNNSIISPNSTNKIVGIIPARYASTRFPGKPLIDIQGKTMIQRVYEQAKKSLLQKVVVATDDERIYDHVVSFGGEAVMTAAHHASGTDRCFDALQQLDEKFDYVVNIQGDEPLINPQQINELVEVLKSGEVELATQMVGVNDYETLFNVGEVKIELNKNNEALCFSRSVIPFMKGVDEKEWHLHHHYYRHVGMYAYRVGVLDAITKLPVSSLENAESLEQMRWLENGFKIKCVETKYESHCVDTPEDVEAILHLL